VASDHGVGGSNPSGRASSHADSLGARAYTGTATLTSFSIGTPTRLPYSVQEPS
jgi:hypothetical protein